MVPPRAERPSGVATSSTLVPPRACSPRTPATALTREEDDADRRRRIVAIAPGSAAPIAEWLSGSAAAWTEVLEALTPAQRSTIVAAMRAYEAALEKHAASHR
jgi:hypothetical protein